MTDPKYPRRRLSRQLDELPGLFDFIDISRDDIAGDIISKAYQPAESEQDIPEIAENDLAKSPSLKFISLGSGSSGNCAYIGTENAGLLIDAGVDNNFVTNELLHNGIDMSQVRGILLTHDHSDHVKYAYPILRRNQHMLLYCTPKTLNGLLRRHNISRRIKDYHTAIYKEFPFQAAGMDITAFEVCHDGTDNVGFSIEAAGMRFVVTTDTGIISERADYYMREADSVMIEANYDAEMLRNGPYPEHLKARIASERGHMDNADTARYLSEVIAGKGKLANIFLCHLSHDNNCPEQAQATIRQALVAAGATVTDTPDRQGILLSILPRFATSRLFILHPKR